MIVCNNCHTANDDGCKFCTSCGAALETAPVAQNTYVAPQYEQPQYTPPVSEPLTGAPKILGLISMICGIVSLCSCYAGFPFAIAAMILCNIARNKAPGVDNPKANLGKKLGIWGLVVSGVCLIAYIILVAVAAAANLYSY